MKRSNAAGRPRIASSAKTDRDSVGTVSLSPKVPIRKAFKTFGPILRPYRLALIALVVLAIATPIASGSIVWVFRHLIDDVVSVGTTSRFWHYGLLFAIASTGTSILRFVDELLTGWVQTHFVRDSRAMLLDHVLQLPPDHFDKHPLGDTLARLSTDVGATEGVFVSATLAALASAAQVIVLGSFAFALNWRLALLTLAVVPPFAVAAKVFSTRMRLVARERRRRSGNAGAVAEEILSGIGVVQAHNAEHRESQRFENQAQALIRADIAGTRLSALYRPAIDTIELIGGLVVVWFGTLLVGRQQLTIGTMLAFLAYATQLYSPVRSLSKLGTSMQSNLAGVDRVIELLETPVAQVASVRARPPEAARVEFDHVSFAYASSDTEVISDVSFTVEPGHSVALVGPSGSGKSTIARMLLGWYRPDAGAIRVNGHEITASDTSLLRDAISYLPQEPWLFDGTIADNIAYGRPDASPAEICSAAEAADAHDFITALPDGYNSSVGRRGRLLSGGQRQRVALARAFLRDSPILVLDEPLTGLDPMSADRILPPLRRLMAGRATLIISHHLELAVHSDQVLVLQDGRIAESGTHQWLLANGSVYRQLHRSQPQSPPSALPPQSTRLFDPPTGQCVSTPTTAHAVGALVEPVRSAPSSTVQVEFDRVSFSFSSGSNQLISDISFTLETGQSVALVGANGSAIARLLLGSVKPSAGAIRVNEHAITNSNIDSLRNSISYLPQEPSLLEGTIAANIAYGRPNSSLAEISAAAVAADAHDFIIGLPDGYETRVGRRDTILTGGQRQRIAIARAFLTDSPILVLDEPLSVLDLLSDDPILPTLRRLMSGRATLVISHHLELAKLSDVVHVLHQGRIVESGPHDWLIANGEIYRELHRGRLSHPETEVLERRLELV